MNASNEGTPARRGLLGGLALLPDSEPARQARDARSSGRPGTHAGEHRTASQKDVDRLLYARSFLRLGAVTQIATPDPLRPVVHNRLTHTLKVAQISRTIAGNLICQALESENSTVRDLILSLGGLDASVAEAAALAHDIGHPPFGHAGEAVLDKLARETGSVIGISDGFEGNAQSFRAATKTDPMYDFTDGLDLTAASRAAILKYPWPRPTIEIPAPGTAPKKQRRLREKKFGYYYTESNQFEQARKWLDASFNDPGRPEQTLEASIMDIADDITYALHDYEDFLTMGVLHQDTVRADLQDLTSLQDSQGKTERGSIVALLSELSGYDRFDFSLLKLVAEEHLKQLPMLFNRTYNRAFRNGLLDELLRTDSIHVTRQPRNDVGAHVSLADKPWHLVELLKFFVKHYVINSSGLALLQTGQGALLRKGVTRLVRWRDDDPRRLPPELSSRLIWAAQRGEPPQRAYLDYICTLGDEQFEAITLSMSGERTGRFGSGSPLG